MMTPNKIRKYGYLLIAVGAFIVRLFDWGASHPLNISASGRGFLFVLPLIVLGSFWEAFFGPAGASTFAFWCIATFFFYLSWKNHKRLMYEQLQEQLHLEHLEKFVGPIKPVALSAPQMTSLDKKGCLIMLIIVTIIFLAPLLLFI